MAFVKKCCNESIELKKKHILYILYYVKVLLHSIFTTLQFKLFDAMVRKTLKYHMIQKNVEIKKMRAEGIEPSAQPWKGYMLPLHHARHQT